METTTYKCDSCGEETVGNSTLKWVAIGVKEQRYSSFNPGITLQDGLIREKQMCLKCRIKFGIHKENLPPGTPDPTFPTLEGMIREIVREEIS